MPVKYTHAVLHEEGKNDEEEEKMQWQIERTAAVEEVAKQTCI